MAGIRPAFADRPLAPFALAAILLAVGLALTLLAHRLVAEQHERETRQRFDTRAGIVFNEIGERLGDYRNIILGLQGLFLASPQVDRKAFNLYYRSLLLENQLSGLEALAFQRLVRHRDKAAFVDRVRHDRALDSHGYPTFDIRPEGERPEYVVFEFLEPMAPNAGEFGFDAATRAGNADAIRLARDTGRFQASQPLNIPHGQTGRSRLLLRAPVYRHGAPRDGLEQRRDALEGFVVLSIDSQAAFGTKFANFALAGESLAIDDLGLAQAASAAAPLRVFASAAAADGTGGVLGKTARIEFGGRNWELRFSVDDAWRRHQPGRDIPALILVGGSLVSLLVAGLGLTLAQSRKFAFGLAHRMTRDLRRSEERFRAAVDVSSEWYWEQDRDHRFIDTSGGAHARAGLDFDLAKGKTRWELAPDALPPAEWAAHRAALEARQPFTVSYPLRTGDGVRWLEAKGLPRFDENGEFVGYHGTGRDITAQIEAGQRLRQQADLLQTVLERMNQGISVVDGELRLVAWNRRFIELLGFPEALGRAGTPFEDFVRHNAQRGEYGPGDLEELVRERVELARRFAPHSLKRQRPDGTILQIVGNPMPDGGFVTTYTDITEQELAAERILAERNFRQHLIESIPGIFYLFDPEGHYLMWNRNLETVSGFSAEEIAAMRPLDLYEETDRRQIAQKAGDVIATGSSAVEARLQAKDGRLVHYYLTGERIVLDSGRPAILGVGLDMSELRRAREMLEAQTAVLQATLEAMDQGISVVDGELRMRALNRRFCEMLEFPEEMARAGASFEDFVRFNAQRGEYGPCNVEDKVRELAERARHPVPHRFRRTRPNGRVIEVCGNPMPGGGFVTTYTDVTEQEQAQAALRESEARFRRIIEQSPISMAIATLDGTLELVNRKVHDTFGYLPEDIPRLDVWYLKAYPDPAYRQEVIEQWTRLVQEAFAGNHEIEPQEYRVTCKDGSEKVVEIFGVPMTDKVLIMLVDVTARKNAEAGILRLNESLEQRVRERTAELEASNQELESFSYSVSHDLRAPLRALNGFSHLLQEEYSHRIDANGLQYLSRIRAASNRMGELIDNLLDLARVSRQELKRVPLDLSALANEIRESLEEQFPQRKLAWHIAPGLQVRADPVLAKALLENLLRNAWKFTAEREDARIELSVAAQDGEAVFCVRDNGAGFEMAYADKLFKPFQRLHDAKRFEGTGIGLAIVHRILHRHGGRIWAVGAPGEGAAFHFTLP
ncbi:MAG: PAS-domain containing protein [Burkholderiales bacterium]|nr:PAS-domain containing protein [Burkholderiales bacterium]